MHNNRGRAEGRAGCTVSIYQPVGWYIRRSVLLPVCLSQVTCRLLCIFFRSIAHSVCWKLSSRPQRAHNIDPFLLTTTTAIIFFGVIFFISLYESDNSFCLFCPAFDPFLGFRGKQPTRASIRVARFWPKYVTGTARAPQSNIVGRLLVFYNISRDLPTLN